MTVVVPQGRLPGRATCVALPDGEEVMMWSLYAWVVYYRLVEYGVRDLLLMMEDPPWFVSACQ